jgi:hypothetical protein
MIANLLSHKIEKPSPEKKYTIIQTNQIPLQNLKFRRGKNYLKIYGK